MNPNNVMKKIKHVRSQKVKTHDLGPLNIPELNNN